MRTNLALLNIGHNLPRTLVALAGIGVAIVLMFMQLGFRGAVENTATTLYDRMEFDLLVRSRGYLHFVEPGAIDAALLDELRSLDSVREVRVLQVGLAGWLSPDQQRLRGLMVLGIDPRQPPFQAAALPVNWTGLTEPGSLFIDTTSSQEFGPADQRQFGVADLGRSAELNGVQFYIRGLFTLGAGLTANGSVVTNLDGFQRINQGATNGSYSLGLIQLTSASDVEQTRAGLQNRLTGANGFRLADVLTRDEVTNRELDRWIN
jgi:putative ABC transport system permease protein